MVRFFIILNVDFLGIMVENLKKFERIRYEEDEMCVYLLELICEIFSGYD